MAWTVEVLNDTVRAEIRELPADLRARFVRLGDRIRQMGLVGLREPHVKHLDGKLWEMRLIGRDGIARALYVTVTGERIDVVRVFIKKVQRTPRAEIDFALQRAKEIQ